MEDCSDLLVFWTQTNRLRRINLCSCLDDREIARDSCLAWKCDVPFCDEFSCTIRGSTWFVGVGHTLGQLYVYLKHVEYVEACHDADIKSEALLKT